MKRACFAVAALSLAACAHGVAVRQGPPLHVKFAPPPGMAQLQVAKQDRRSKVEFPDRDPVESRELVKTSERETWEPLKDGGWRITSLMLDEQALRDGMPVESAVPLKGIPFVHTVNADGSFRAAEDVGITIQAIEERATTKELKEMLKPLLTPSLVAQRLELAWKRRTEGLCGSTLTPGEVFYGVDSQDLPAGGPVVSLVKSVVVGRSDLGTQPAVELALEFGGQSSELAKEPGAQVVERALPQGETITQEVKGKGRRLVSLDSCQVLAEDATLSGAWRLNKAAIGNADPKAFPEKIGFDVSRAATVYTGPSAAAAEPLP